MKADRQTDGRTYIKFSLTIYIYVEQRHVDVYIIQNYKSSETSL